MKELEKTVRFEDEHRCRERALAVDLAILSNPCLFHLATVVK
jgi:hypothetical protein